MTSPSIIGASGALGTVSGSSQNVTDITHQTADLLIVLACWDDEPRTGFWNDNTWNVADPGSVPLTVTSTLTTTTQINSFTWVTQAVSAADHGLKISRVSGTFAEAITYALIVVRGGIATPNVSTSRTKLGDTTASVSFPSVTTTSGECLIIQALFNGVFNNSTNEGTATFAGHANASLTSVTEQVDVTSSVTFGVHGMNLVTGFLAGAGASGSTTATATVSGGSRNHAHELTYSTIAIAPSSPSGWSVGSVRW